MARSEDTAQRKLSGCAEPDGDRINAVLAAAGYNFSLLLRRLAAILRACILALSRIAQAAQRARETLNQDSSRTTA